MAEKANNYALVIGVSEYGAFDESVGNKPGTSDVPGARNDARAWFHQCLELGFSADRIRVLTAPELSADELGPGAVADNLALATHDNIVAGMNWLAEMTDGDTASAGLMTYSGHGTGHDEQSLALLLCPCDTVAAPEGEAEDGGLDNVVNTSEVRQALGNGRVAQRLTVVLDCCSAQVGVARATSIRGRLDRCALGEGAGAGPVERVLSACAWDQVSESSQFCGLEMGAFTWAMTSTLSQWNATVEDGVVRLDASNGQLIKRSRALLEALDFGQRPVLSGPRGASTLPFLEPADESGDNPVGNVKETTRSPDRERSKRQLDSGQGPILNSLSLGGSGSQVWGFTEYKWDCWDSISSYKSSPSQPDHELARVYAMGGSFPESRKDAQFIVVNSVAVLPGMEYWDWDTDAAKSMWSNGELDVSGWVMQLSATPFQSLSRLPRSLGDSCTIAGEVQNIQPEKTSAYPPASDDWVTFQGGYPGGSLAISFQQDKGTYALTHTQWFVPSSVLLCVAPNVPLVLYGQPDGGTYPAPPSDEWWVEGPILQVPYSPDALVEAASHLPPADL